MNIRDAIFVVVDTETTGLDPTKDKLVEIAAVATTYREVVAMWGTLVDPEIPIPPEVMGIHGITDEMVAGALDATEAIGQLSIFEMLVRADVDVSHNRDFDAAFLSRKTIPGLCTKRLAQHVWPDAPNHRNQTLRYWRKLRFDDYGVQPHRALGDAIVTAALLRDIIDAIDLNEIDTVEKLQALSDKPILYRNWWLGKSYGEPIVGTDPGYIRWALKNVEMDADKRFSLEEALRAS